MIFPKTLKLTPSQIDEIQAILTPYSCKVEEYPLQTRFVYLIIGENKPVSLYNELLQIPYINRISDIESPYKLMDKYSEYKNFKIKLGKKKIGESPVFIAGVCAIDLKNPNLFMETAHAIKEAGADVLRGGVWKPRTRAYSYQGCDKALDLLIEAGKLTKLPINTEVLNGRQLKLCIEAGVDVVQVGTRNALNYELLKEIGQKTAGSKTCVLLKKHRAITPVDEFLGAAEYLVLNGNPNIILCLRGAFPKINSFRAFPDESTTLLLKEKTWAPVIIDPSHSVAQSHFVPSAALAGISYGADGLSLEVHIDPKSGIADDPAQSIKPSVLEKIIRDAKTLYDLRKKYY